MNPRGAYGLSFVGQQVSPYRYRVGIHWTLHPIADHRARVTRTNDRGQYGAHSLYSLNGCGVHGTNGTNGTNSTNSTNGTNGTNSTNSTNSTHGAPRIGQGSVLGHTPGDVEDELDELHGELMGFGKEIGEHGKKIDAQIEAQDNVHKLLSLLLRKAGLPMGANRIGTITGLVKTSRQKT